MSGSRHDPSLAMSLLFLFQILTVAVSGLLRTETARVWIFLLPLLMFPIGNELARWRFFSTPSGLLLPLVPDELSASEHEPDILANAVWESMVRPPSDHGSPWGSTTVASVEDMPTGASVIK